MYYNKVVGNFGEEQVESYLVRNNYIIISKNFSCKFGEIDVIARDISKNEVVFIEVKTRKTSSYGSPAEAVGFYKKRHIYKTAEYFIFYNRLEHECIRFDVIEVFLGKQKTYSINHIKQAF